MFERLRVGIMGTGRIAGVMAATLKEMRGVACYAVGSRDAEKAARFGQLYNVKKTYGSYQELVEDPKVDLIYVATPHSEHYKNVMLALSAGKNVICEKPFMLNERQAKEVFAFAEEKKLLVTEAMWTRYMPIRNKIKEVLASNVIGEPTMLTANLGYNITYKDRIQQPALGGGALLDLGVYVLNFASMVFGNDVADIASICTLNNLGVDMQDSITLRYNDGKMAILNATVLSVSDKSAVIYGSKGYIVVDNITNPEGLSVYDNDYRKVAYYKRQKQLTGYEYEIEACFKAISEGWLECPDMPHSETLKMLNMMDFIRRNNNIVFPGDEVTEEQQEQVPQIEAQAADQDQSGTVETQVETQEQSTSEATQDQNSSEATEDQGVSGEDQEQTGESRSGLLLQMSDTDV